MFGNTSQRLATPTQNRYFGCFYSPGGNMVIAHPQIRKGSPAPVLRPTPARRRLRAVALAWRSRAASWTPRVRPSSMPSFPPGCSGRPRGPRLPPRSLRPSPASGCSGRRRGRRLPPSCCRRPPGDRPPHVPCTITWYALIPSLICILNPKISKP